MPETGSEYLHRFANLAIRQEFAREVVDPQGHGIEIWTKLSERPGAPVILLSSGIHGDERSGPEALLHFMAEWTFSREIDWVVSPLLNPSGFGQGTRCNAEGIDLNRDFLRRQCRETEAFMNWWAGRSKPCQIHLSLHEDWEAEGFYLYEIDTSGRSESLAPAILESVTEVAPLQSNGPVDGHPLAAPGLIVHEAVADEPEGWPEAIWLTRTWPVQSYTLEAPGQLAPEVRVKSLVAALRGALGRSP